jgi:hypothetical protein
LIAVGGLVSLCAAIGLVLSGPAVVRVLEEVLTWQTGDPPGDAVGDLFAAMLSALMYAAGAAVVCVGLLIAARSQVASPLGRVLIVGAGLAIVVGAVVVFHGLMTAQRGLHTLATSSTVLAPQTITEMVSPAVPAARIGFAVLLVGQIFLVGVGTLGFSNASPRTESGFATKISVKGIVLLNVIFASLFVWNWWLHGRSIEQITTGGSQMPNPAELAGHLSAIMTKAQFASTCLAVGGILHGLVAILLPSRATAD